MDDKKDPYQDHGVSKEKMELLSPREVLGWAYQNFGTVPWVACSFGKDSMALLGLLREIGILEELKVLWIDTGYDFAETLKFKDKIQKEWNQKLSLKTYQTYNLKPLLKH